MIDGSRKTGNNGIYEKALLASRHVYKKAKTTPIFHLARLFLSKQLLKEPLLLLLPIALLLHTLCSNNLDENIL